MLIGWMDGPWDTSFITLRGHTVKCVFWLVPTGILNPNPKPTFFCSFLFIYLEREHEQGRGRERGRERSPSRLHTVSMETNVGLKLTKHEIMTWAEAKSRTVNWLSHPGAPKPIFLKSFLLSLFLSDLGSLFPNCNLYPGTLSPFSQHTKLIYFSLWFDVFLLEIGSPLLCVFVC